MLSNGRHLSMTFVCMATVACSGCNKRAEHIAATCSSLRPVAQDPATQRQAIIDSIAHITPWSGIDDYGSEDWASLRRSAILVQESDPAVVEQAIRAFRAQCFERTSDVPVDCDSQVFLLLRMVFDLPEDAPVHERAIFIGWMNWPEVDETDSVNLAWPLSWASGAPSFVASQFGAMGAPYAAVEEYRHMLEHYGFRRVGE